MRRPAALTPSASTASASLRSRRRRRASRRALGAARARQRARPRPRHLDHGLSAPPASRWKSGCTISRCCPSVDPYLATAVSLARSALGGAGAVMVHYTRVQGLTDLPTEAAEVARAAARRRRARRLRGRDAQPQSAGLWPVRADPGGAAAAGARGDRAALHPHAAAGRRSRSRWSMPWPRRRPIRCSTCNTARRRCSGARTSCSKAIARRLRADRPPHPHASAGNPLPSAPGRTPIIPAAS